VAERLAELIAQSAASAPPPAAAPRA